MRNNEWLLHIDNSPSPHAMAAFIPSTTAGLSILRHPAAC